MDIRQLTYFVRIVELGSFSRAAEALRVAQPALGVQIKKLEDELGVPLLVRHSRGIEPTEQGRLLLSHANAVLAAVEGAKRELKEYGSPLSGNVTIGLSPGLADILAAQLIRVCTQEAPEVSLHITELLSGELTQQIAQNASALAFAVSSVASLDSASDLVSEPLLREDLYLVGSRETLEVSDEPVPYSTLAGRKLVVLGTGIAHRTHGLRQLLEAASIVEGVQLNVAFEMQSIAAVKDLVKAGLGYGILPSATVSDRVSDGTLVARRIVQPPVSRTLYFVRSRRRPLSKAEDHVAAALKKIIRDEIDREGAIWSTPG
jgi:LysR family nitrogen assimilation transcriptional regulator